ncbi:MULTISPECIES: hypothetical protein [Burkholderiaceae]|uniref:hypothetical protein n=1 Tax=Burkholderiaceae TaxID=119060 RepID=UPI00142103EF|nr:MULTISPECIES: hypothetical protein [Burkholderiaceae]MBN3846481.1 hypothetical protein [Paraburkholderia sp. Ac-20342]NIF54733.1 hypothetical protein [Burkholderia sp. Ax-1724]
MMKKRGARYVLLLWSRWREGARTLVLLLLSLLLLLLLPPLAMRSTDTFGAHTGHIPLRFE